MIQDIFPHTLTNQFIENKEIKETDYLFIFKNNSYLLKSKGDEFEIPTRKDFPELTDQTEVSFLFTLNNTPCYLVWDNLEIDNSDFIYKEIDFFRITNQQEIAWASMVAYHLRNWYVENKYCGKCGSKTVEKSDERALECTSCHSVIYPKISPAVIVAITCKDKILLARGASWTSGTYSCLAGYVDVGESLEECLMREVKEEVGIEIKNIRYYKSQPWPMSGSMMIGYVAEADDKQPIVLEEEEIADAKWFARDNLPKYSSKISIAGEMIEKFEKGEL